jgi:hypothetical protein
MQTLNWPPYEKEIEHWYRPFFFTAIAVFLHPLNLLNLELKHHAD